MAFLKQLRGAFQPRACQAVGGTDTGWLMLRYIQFLLLGRHQAGRPAHTVRRVPFYPLEYPYFYASWSGPWSPVGLARRQGPSCQCCQDTKDLLRRVARFEKDWHRQPRSRNRNPARCVRLGWHTRPRTLDRPVYLKLASCPFPLRLRCYQRLLYFAPAITWCLMAGNHYRKHLQRKKKKTPRLKWTWNGRRIVYFTQYRNPLLCHTTTPPHNRTRTGHTTWYVQPVSLHTSKN